MRKGVIDVRVLISDRASNLSLALGLKGRPMGVD
jgi:hypothetical protein